MSKDATFFHHCGLYRW